ncbi:glycosyltransferase family 2 protein [Shewanella chilikensis]|uniref:glycosyltransferase family 2 protein n=1 Tax=Shewanella chilikensis TaxID=558541 RepID=UPI00399BEC1D
MNKVCAVVITYNPELERLFENVNSVLPQVDELLIVDNGSKNLTDFETKLKSLANFKYTLISLNENKGIGFALNQAVLYCKDNNFDYLFTLDQDSIITVGLISGLFDTILSDTDIAMVGPKICDVNELVSNSCEGNLLEVNHLITSGALCRVSCLESVGGFNERLFIDCVDFDMSLKLREKGYRVVRDNRFKLIHEIGKKERKTFFNRHFYLLNHSDVRVYYMVRNRICLVRRYRKLKNYRPLLDLKHLVTRTLAMLVYEQHKTAKLVATFKGIYDGLVNYSFIMKR